MTDLSSTLRVKDAARLLGVTPQTVRNWVTRGQLPALRHPVNGYRLFNLSDLTKVMELKQPPPADPGDACTYRQNGDRGVREYSMKGGVRRSSIVSERRATSYSAADFELDWLRQKRRPAAVSARPAIRVADAFCGGGIFSLGVDEGLRSVGLRSSHVLGIDFDRDAIATFELNFPGSRAILGDVLMYAHGALGAKPSLAERELMISTGEIDVLIGGPPCQGNSDLNNHTRRVDPKNELYFSMVRLAELLRPKLMIIENVPGVLHDKGQVVARTSAALLSLGYSVDQAVVELQALGVPQRRKRLIVVAWRNGTFNIAQTLARHEAEPRPMSWAIADLEGKYDATSVYDSSATHSAENQRRINYLFSHDLHDLPNSQRPPCHRDKAHSYVSVYGRMHWDRVAPTITGGFGSTGQGRFVHPRQPRTITPHEACRLQFVPDFFRFPLSVGRRSMQQIVGNAAPPKLSQVLISEAVAGGLLE